MILSAVKGGLGNMMFQIAAGVSLSKSLNVDYAYTFDFWGSSTSYDISRYPETIFKNITKVDTQKLDLSAFRRYIESSFGYSPIPSLDNLVIEGYFQSKKHFNENFDLITSIFNVEKIKKYEDYTFLHVRRKDYLKFKDVHPVCTIDYYRAALNFVCPEKCIIISDDIPWCRENFSDQIFEFSDSSDDLVDLSIMKSCRNSIISNSTFSWWGSVLGESKITIAPSLWFGIHGPNSWSDIYCDGWKII